MISKIFFQDQDYHYALSIVHECLRSLNLVLNFRGEKSADDSEVKFNHKSAADYLLGDASAGHPWHVSSSFHTVFAKGCLGVILSHKPVINICDIYDFRITTLDLDALHAVGIYPEYEEEDPQEAHYLSMIGEGDDYLHEFASDYEIDPEEFDDDDVENEIAYSDYDTEFSDPSASSSIADDDGEGSDSGESAKSFGFSKKASKRISQLLRYCVAHWITHFVCDLDEVDKTSPIWRSLEFKELSPVLAKFMSSHVFFWIECASLIRVLDSVIEQLAQLKAAIAKAPKGIFDSTTRKLVKHTYRFIREFKDPIIQCPPQVYNSGYAFTPKETTLYKTYAAQLEDKIPFRVTGGVRPTWDSREMIFAEDDHLLRFLDGKFTASISSDKNIEIRDASTDDVMRILKGTNDNVTAIDISDDGKWIISVLDEKTIKLWDAATCKISYTLERHKHPVTGVTVTSDGRYIITRDKSSRVIVWVKDEDKFTPFSKKSPTFDSFHAQLVSHRWEHKETYKSVHGYESKYATGWIRHGKHIVNVRKNEPSDSLPEFIGFTPSGGTILCGDSYRPIVIEYNFPDVSQAP